LAFLGGEETHLSGGSSKRRFVYYKQVRLLVDVKILAINSLDQMS